MLVFTNYHATDDLAVLLPRANWSTPPKLTTEFPFTDIERAILGNETRRCYGLTEKHTLEVTSTIIFNDFDATALRQGLNRLKDELVGVPIWTDFLRTTSALTTTGTSVNFSGAPPPRAGARWLFVSADGESFELVTVTVVGLTSLTFAARTGSAWPAGSYIYPMLFGRFQDRPNIEAIGPSSINAPMTIVEDSDITEKISPTSAGSIDIATVGSHIADFSHYLLWTLPPVAEPRWIDTDEADILYAQLGFSRQEQSYAQQNWNRRGLEMEFDCLSRAQIAHIENFFAGRLGPVRHFFIPTFRNDLKLAADITAGAGTFTIAPSRYEDAAYDDPPGNAFLAFVDSTGVYPQRITSVASTTLTTESAIGENHKAATTRTCFLMLARFAGTKLEWEYITPSRARVKIKFLELPDEYVAPVTDSTPQAYLFDFTETLPNTTVNRYRFTNCDSQLVFASNTYLVAPFSLGERDVGLELDDKSELKSWGLFSGSPLNRFLPYNLNASLMCTVTRVNAQSPNDGSARVLFYGQVTVIAVDGREWTATLRDPVAVLLDRNYPRPLYQTQDNVDVYQQPTSIDPNDFKSTGAIATLSVGGNSMQITVTGVGGEATDWFSSGWLQTGTGGNQELRSILKNTLASGIQTLTLDRPLIFAIVGQSIDLFAGYDGSREQRDTKFSDNVGFEGMPFMPDTNPSIAAADIKTPSGGKK